MSRLDPQQLKQLLIAVARKDANAFRVLYEQTSPNLFGFALRILSKQELAEDAIQEAFINIWNSAASYQSSLAAPMTWMTTIVRNKAFDLLRRLDHVVELDAATFDQSVMDTIESAEPNPAQAYELDDDARALANCFAQLEGSQRQAIALAFYRDMSHAEVASQMVIPIGTAKTWIRRGLERLQRCLIKLERV